MQILIQNILRPYRSTYSYIDLGKKHTQDYNRIDDTIINDRDLHIHYSYYQHTIKTDICIIYCHCNSGSRIQGIQYLEQFIKKGWNVCLFDFSGSGKSQGEYISLGYYESSDLEIIIHKLRAFNNTKFMLWGRSMGASTSKLQDQFLIRDDIIGCILDSPYSSLWLIIKHIINTKSIIPNFIIQKILDYLREIIKQKHLFDIKRLQPLKIITHIKQPLLFITSQQDQYVKCQQVIKLYKNTNSKIKQLEYIQKLHNQTRDKDTVINAINFLSKNLNQKNKRKKEKRGNINGRNMADMIIRVEKQKNKIRRMKSQNVLDRSKENIDRNNRNCQYGRNEFVTMPSAVLMGRDQIQKGKKVRGRAIKFSLAHVLQKNRIERNNNRQVEP